MSLITIVALFVFVYGLLTSGLRLITTTSLVKYGDYSVSSATATWWDVIATVVSSAGLGIIFSRLVEGG